MQLFTAYGTSSNFILATPVIAHLNKVQIKQRNYRPTLRHKYIPLVYKPRCHSWRIGMLFDLSIAICTVLISIALSLPKVPFKTR